MEARDEDVERVNELRFFGSVRSIVGTTALTLIFSLEDAAATASSSSLNSSGMVEFFQRRDADHILNTLLLVDFDLGTGAVVVTVATVVAEDMLLQLRASSYE